MSGESTKSATLWRMKSVGCGQFRCLGRGAVREVAGVGCGRWFDSDIGDDEGPKSISHEHTFNEDTNNVQQLESTLARLSEMVCRRLREHKLYAGPFNSSCATAAFAPLPALTH